MSEPTAHNQGKPQVGGGGVVVREGGVGAMTVAMGAWGERVEYRRAGPQVGGVGGGWRG